jgi:hypothetical protein
MDTDDETTKAKLLPARELMSLIDPGALPGVGGLGGVGAGSVDPAPATDAAGSELGHAHTLADEQAAGQPGTVSDQPQSVDGTSVDSASSTT